MRISYQVIVCLVFHSIKLKLALACKSYYFQIEKDITVLNHLQLGFFPRLPPGGGGHFQDGLPRPTFSNLMHPLAGLQVRRVLDQTKTIFDLSFSYNQRWEFIKENKRVRKQENTLSTKKAIKRTRKKERKHALDQEIDQIGKDNGQEKK